MRSLSFAVLVSVFVGLGTTSALQPPGGGGGKKGGGPPNQGKGPPQGQGPGQGQGQGPGRGNMPRYELGKVLPPMAMQSLQLSDEQKTAIAQLEADVKAKLQKILTAEQLKQLSEGAQQRPMGGQGGPGGDRPMGGPGGPGSNRRPDGELSAAPAGIQWYATLDAAKAETQRTGLPILLVSAAPHCSGISGIW